MKSPNSSASSMMPKVIVDASLPYLREALTTKVEAIYLPSQDITKETILAHQASALLIRSVCKCNKDLLENTPIHFIATATAGIDHIDEEYCQKHNIFFCNAPGCNAPAVAEYVFGVLARIALKEKCFLDSYTLGIIGVGNVGKQVLKYAKALGMKTLLYDPIREKKEGRKDFCSLNKLLGESDIISLHIPLTHNGLYPTFHMVNKETFSQMKRTPILINAARGAVLNTKDLLDALENKQIREAFIDCWEGEPLINQELLNKVPLATPHIAGFSAESKARGSRMIVQEMAKFFGLQIETSSITPPPLTQGKMIDAKNFADWTIERCLECAINIPHTDQLLRKNPLSFEQLRVNYNFHREPEAYEIINAEEKFKQKLKEIGFLIH